MKKQFPPPPSDFRVNKRFTLDDIAENSTACFWGIGEIKNYEIATETYEFLPEWNKEIIDILRESNALDFVEKRLVEIPSFDGSPSLIGAKIDVDIFYKICGIALQTKRKELSNAFGKVTHTWPVMQVEWVVIFWTKKQPTVH